MSVTVSESVRYCRRITRNRARNFYYAFVLLPRAEHDAMCALYAFMRRCDDLSDDSPDPAAAKAGLESWRRELDAALAGRPPAHPLWPAFLDTVDRYHIPARYFYEMIEGVSSDLDPAEFATFSELYRYCYRVASVVGLSVIHILGYTSDRALELAEKCGIAFQLTNILRDVREDAACGRIYLPTEDLKRFAVERQALLEGRTSGDWQGLLRFEADRARSFYQESASLPGLVKPSSRRALRALIAIYRALLEKIEREDFDIMSRRISLTPLEKTSVVARAWAGFD